MKLSCIFAYTFIETNMTTQELHTLIKSKLSTRTNEELVSDAKVARLNKSDETQRMIFALVMDTLQQRLPILEFEEIYESIID